MLALIARDRAVGALALGRSRVARGQRQVASHVVDHDQALRVAPRDQVREGRARRVVAFGCLEGLFLCVQAKR